MTMLYPNLCKNEECYKGTALYCTLSALSNVQYGQLTQFISAISSLGQIKKNVSKALPHLFQMPLICLFSDLNKKKWPHLFYSYVKIKISTLLYLK